MSRHYVRTSRGRDPRPPGPPGRRASRPRPGPPARRPPPAGPRARLPHRRRRRHRRPGAGLGRRRGGRGQGLSRHGRLWRVWRRPARLSPSARRSGARRRPRRRSTSRPGRSASASPAARRARRGPGPAARAPAATTTACSLTHTPVRHGRRVLPREPQNGRRRRLRGRVRDVRLAVGASAKASKVQVRRVGAWEDLVPDVCVRRGGAWTKAQAKGVPHLANPPDAGRLLRSS